MFALNFRRWLRRIACLLAFVCTLVLTCYFFRAPLLTGVARAWVVNDATTNADAIVVLGGRPDLRPLAAAQLYRAGVAPRVLFMEVKPNRASEQGLALTETEVTRRVLLSNDVPEAAMIAVGDGVATTYDESRAVRSWLATNNVKMILIVTDVSHTRRARWIFCKELEGTGVQVRVHAIQSKAYGLTNWWLHEEGLIDFQNEFIKSLYYHVKSLSSAHKRLKTNWL